MKKSSKIFVLIASILLIMGSIIFVKALADNNWKFNSLGTSKFVENTYEFEDDISSIVIDSDTSDIKLEKSNDGINRVVCYGPEKLIHDVSLNESTLKVITHNESKWYDNIFSFGEYKITVYLVNNELDLLDIDESTGDIDITSNFSFKTVDIEASTGDVKINSCIVDELKISLDTGDITVNKITSNNANLEVSTGMISVSELECKGYLSIKVSTGKTIISNCEAKEFSSTGSTGSIYLNEFIVKEKISIVRDTGDVIFSKMDGGEILIKTDTGKVSGSLLSDKVFIIETDTGRKEYPKTTTGGRCEITTDTGDIIITIEK